MFCSSCGTELPSSAKFCFNCGTEVDGKPAGKQFVAQENQQIPNSIAFQERKRAQSSELDGERKPVTVLFADIVGSTSIAERLDPEEWKEVVSGAHRRVGDAIRTYEGTIAQLLGDGVLAFFGAPTTHEDDPVRAVRAALDIQDAMAAYEQELAGLVDEFKMRIGINTGTVVLGDVGSDWHVEYLAIGDAVNTAARLQSVANPGEILISDATAHLIGGDFSLENRGDLEMKGKSEAIRSSLVLGLGETLLESHKPNRVQSAYVGRGAELEALRSNLQALDRGRGHLVAIMGEPGIGKSRLVDEARKLPEARQTRWLEGRALSYGSSLSFWLITQLLLNDLELSDGAPMIKIKVALRNRVAELFDDGEEDAYAYLGHLLGLEEDPEVKARVGVLDGETLKRETLVTLGQYFQRIADLRSTVLVFEDLHWADPSSLETLSRLMPLTERSALMIIMLMRIEREHGSWRLRLDAETDFADRFTELLLNRLPDEEAMLLAHDLLGNNHAAVEIQELIRSRAGGNPLHLEEVINQLIEQGLIERSNGAWQPTSDIETAGIPSTLEGILLARIDQLESDVRNTLQLASVIGRSFLYQILEAISDVERELDWHLSQLQRADLVREKAHQPDLEYMFKHALTQEAAYNSLLLERRKEFHLRVGEAIEGLYPDREADKLAGQLGRHFQLAGRDQKAISYHMKASRNSIALFANEEAASHLRQALDLSNEMPESRGRARQEIRMYTLLGSIHAATHGVASLEAKAAYDRGLELCERYKIKGPRLAIILVGLWGSHLNRAEHKDGRRLAKEIFEAATEVGTDQFLVSGHWAMGITHHVSGDLQNSRNHLEKAVQLNDPGHRFLNAFTDPVIPCQGLLSNVLHQLGYPVQGEKQLEEAREYAEEFSNPSGQLIASLYRVFFYQIRREFDQALASAEYMISMGTQQSAKELLALGIAFRGAAMSQVGRAEEGIVEIIKGIDRYKSTDARVLMPYMHFLLADAQREASSYDDALISLREALTLVENLSEHYVDADMHRLNGDLLIAIGDEQQAEQSYRQALDISRSQNAKSWELRAAMSLGRLRQKQGRSAEATELLEPIYSWFVEGFDTPDLIDAKEFLDKLMPN